MMCMEEKAWGIDPGRRLLRSAGGARLELALRYGLRTQSLGMAVMRGGALMFGSIGAHTDKIITSALAGEQWFPVGATPLHHRPHILQVHLGRSPLSQSI